MNPKLKLSKATLWETMTYQIGDVHDVIDLAPGWGGHLSSSDWIINCNGNSRLLLANGTSC